VSRPNVGGTVALLITLGVIASILGGSLLPLIVVGAVGWAMWNLVRGMPR
jgi:hypothetical protein